MIVDLYESNVEVNKPITLDWLSDHYSVKHQNVRVWPLLQATREEWEKEFLEVTGKPAPHKPFWNNFWEVSID